RDQHSFPTRRSSDLRVIDVTGAVGGRVRELALFPQEDPTQVAAFIVRTPQGDRLLGREDIARIEGGKLQTAAAAAQWMPFNAGRSEEHTSELQSLAY